MMTIRLKKFDIVSHLKKTTAKMKISFSNCQQQIETAYDMKEQAENAAKNPCIQKKLSTHTTAQPINKKPRQMQTHLLRL